MRPLAFNLFFYAYTFFMAFRLYLVARFGNAERMWPLCRVWAETVVRAVEVILRSRIEVRGMENIPTEGPVLLVSKHQSELDVVMLGALFDSPGAVAMQELERYPFFGLILRKLDLVLVPISQGPQKRTADTIEGARRILAQGRPLMIYPEGELMALGAKERYRGGAGRIYEALGCPAVPVAVSLGVVWPKREWRKFEGVTGAIEFLEPIPPGLSFEEVMTELERRIEEGTMRLIREHAPPDRLAHAEDRHARGANNSG